MFHRVPHLRVLVYLFLYSLDLTTFMDLVEQQDLVTLRSESRAFGTLEDYFKVKHGRLEYNTIHFSDYEIRYYLLYVSSQVFSNFMYTFSQLRVFLSHNIA